MKKHPFAVLFVLLVALSLACSAVAPAWTSTPPLHPRPSRPQNLRRRRPPVFESTVFSSSDRSIFVYFASYTKFLVINKDAAKDFGSTVSLTTLEGFLGKGITLGDVQETAKESVYTFQWEMTNGMYGTALYDTHVERTLIVLTIISNKAPARGYEKLSSQILDSYAFNP